MTSILENYDAKIDTSFNIKVSYINGSGEKSEDTYFIDLSIFKGLSQIGKPNLYTIAQEIEKIQKDFHNIATGFKELRVISQSKENYDQEQREWMEKVERKHSENKKV